MTTRAKDTSKAEARRDVDIYVGKQLVALRMAAGENQSDVGRVLGLTFQQIQKYERGANRISASVLHTLAEHFKVPVGRFFEGFGSPQTDAAVASEMGASRAGHKLWSIYAQMNPAQQKALLAVAGVLATPEAAGVMAEAS